MSSSSITQRQQEQVRRLARLSQELAAGLAENRQRLQDQLAAADETCAQVTAQLDEQAGTSLAALEGEYNAQLEAARRRLEERVDALERKRAARSDQLSQQRARAIASAVEDFETSDLRLRDRRTHDAQQLRQRQEEFVAKCQGHLAQLQQLQQQLASMLQRRGVPLPSVDAKSSLEKAKTWSSSLIRAYEAHVERLADLQATMRQSRGRHFLEDGWPLLLLLAVIGIGVVPLGRLTGYAPLPWVAAVLAGGLLVTFVSYQFVHRATARGFRQLAPEIAAELTRAAKALRQAVRASEREAAAGLEELQRDCREQAAQAAQERQQRIERAESEFQQQTTELEKTFTQQQALLDRTWEQETDQIRARYRPRLDEGRSFFAKQRQQALRQAAATRDRAETQFEREREELQARWREAIAEFSQFVDDLRRRCAPVVDGSDADDRPFWTPATSPPQAVPLGHYRLTLPVQPGHEAEPAGAVELPAVLSFPQTASLLLKATGAGRQSSVAILQNATLQLLASFPPGKLRLTIFDPIGLGENFSAFMHLADYDERLVGNRIWTETPHINQRLADLTEHMENVIQKYLRNEFQSIQEYNERAGEVAEPFRVLVVANFPHQFSDEATRRLASIVSSGPRCGVYTLMSVDMSAKLPRDARWDELQRNMQVFQWQDGRFVNEHEPFAELPLQFDAPPDSESLTRIVKAVGNRAQDTRRVEVPFAGIAPAATEIWTKASDEQLTVPIGRSGATQTLALRLGSGTAQHVLIAGKTGSGKSTLLHALITNAALNYSPDEVQFYLVDFKKGVEFKPYADYALPHARVIAIESEREFGLSVLNRLDEELRERGDLFRTQGVQTLAAFRARQPDYPLPRLLLIVDEFQEFFVSDDKLAHEASLLLDRLVRQGRAFGMHVILGSQTLAGAYSLARSTIGQMAVRIALECSAADAHLILSEDNTAARLLGRPGEAIYNDANGRVEGNHPFQVVWLSDQQRYIYLDRLRQMARDQQRQDEPPIVFEGHAAADLANNSELKRLITTDANDQLTQPPRAWLGAPVEIKPPTSVTFRRVSGTNVLVVGQSPELARGLVGSCLLGLDATARRATAGSATRRASFWLLDGDRGEELETTLSDMLLPYLGVPVTAAGPADCTRVMQEMSERLDERFAAADVTHESIYLVIHNLARFRDLQPDADDLGLGRFAPASTSGPASPAAQLSRILRDGPSVGIHTLVWADSFNTLSRWFDRAALRDFGQRVLMQMSAVDSSHLIDSAAASQLGAYRALLHDHDRGQTEKFRPYALPSTTWLAEYQRQLIECSASSPEGLRLP